MRNFLLFAAAMLAFAPPSGALAESGSGSFLCLDDRTLSFIGWTALGTVIGCVLARLWMGICDHVLICHEDISSIQKRKPYLPGARIVIGTVISTGILFVLSL